MEEIKKPLKEKTKHMCGKLLFVEFFIICVVINVSTFLHKSIINNSVRMNELVPVESTYMATVNYNENGKTIEEVKENYEKLISITNAEEYGRNCIEKIRLNREDAEGIFIDKDSLDLYNFNVEGSKDIFNSEDGLKILISSDLRTRYKLNDMVTIKVDGEAVDARVAGYLVPNSRFWRYDFKKYDLSKEVKFSVVIPFGEDTYYNKKIDIELYKRVVLKSTNPDLLNILNSCKVNKIISKNASLKDLQIRNEMNSCSLLFCLGYTFLFISFIFILNVAICILNMTLPQHILLKLTFDYCLAGVISILLNDKYDFIYDCEIPQFIASTLCLLLSSYILRFLEKHYYPRLKKDSD